MKTSVKTRGVQLAILAALWIAAVALFLAAPMKAHAFPAPGTWADIAPPDPVGGAAQAGFQIGTPHLYDRSVVLLLAGGSLDIRLAPWVFVSAAIGGSVPFQPHMGLGPTFCLGGKGALGVRLVVAPRVGMNVFDNPGVLLGGHLLLDLPLGPNGRARCWLGTKYAHGRETSLTVHSDTVFLLTGWVVHAKPRLDLGMQIAGSVYFDTNYGEDRMVGSFNGIHVLTATFQLTAHMGPLSDARVSYARGGG